MPLIFPVALKHKLFLGGVQFLSAANTDLNI